jgi:hypothetical protein
MFCQSISILFLAAAGLAGQGSQSGELKVTQLNFLLLRTTAKPSGEVAREVRRVVRYLAPDGREREEEIDSQGHILHVTLTDAKHASFYLKPDAKAFQQLASGRGRVGCCSPTQPPDPSMAATDRHPEKLAGLDCVGQRPKHPLGEFWATVCRNPATGRWFLARQFLRLPDGSTREEVLESYKLDVAVNSELFRVPADYRQVK